MTKHALLVINIGSNIFLNNLLRYDEVLKGQYRFVSSLGEYWSGSNRFPFGRAPNRFAPVFTIAKTCWSLRIIFLFFNRVTSPILYLSRRSGEIASLNLSPFCEHSLPCTRCSVAPIKTDNPLIRLISSRLCTFEADEVSRYNDKNVGSQWDLLQLGKPSKILASSGNSCCIPLIHVPFQTKPHSSFVTCIERILLRILPVRNKIKLNTDVVMAFVSTVLVVKVSITANVRILVTLQHS